MSLKRALLALSPLGGLAVVAWIAVRAGVSPGEVAGAVPVQTHLWATGAFMVSLFGRGARISLLAQGLSRRLPLARAVGIQLAGEAAAAVTPSRSGSDPARLLVLRRRGVDLPTGLAVLVGEMMAEGIVLLLVVGSLVAFLPGHKVTVLGALPYAFVALALPFVAVLLTRIPTGRDPPGIWRRVGLKEGLWQRLRDAAHRFRAKAHSLRGLRPGTMVLVLGVSLIHVLARLSVLPLLAGISFPEAPLSPLLAWPLVLLYAGALIPPPGGGGAVEVAFAAAMDPLLGGEGLAGILFWWRWYTFYLGGICGGVLLYFILKKGDA